MAGIGRRGLLAGAAGAVAGAWAGGGAARAEPGPEPGPGPGAGGELERPTEPAPPTGPRPELRAMWVATVAGVDWPGRAGAPAAEQRAELLELLDRAVACRLNAVILQVRPTADTLWPSECEPWSQWLTGEQGKDPGWDPLGTAVAEAHARGLELHAWFNPYRIAHHADRARLVARHPARLHPEWTVVHGGRLYYDPGVPEVRELVRRVVLEAVGRYPLDAVHFDDYFYPYPIVGERFADDASFLRHGAGHPTRADWRRANTDALVGDLGERVRAVRPGTRFGVSPFGIWRHATSDPAGSATRAGVQSYDDLYADTLGWARRGWVDYLAPQLYWHLGHPTADYAVLARWWAAALRETPAALYVGEALYKADPKSPVPRWRDPAELSRHLDLTRGLPEVRGHAYFSARQVASDANGAMSRLLADHYREPAPAR
ncbi:glycoside hydrolase family 10 protein [Streptomyces sp. BI20]|uniref:glycoside hydrolase family 10 protein n=1 Tax=Streptomyces sp. BI20 TaxID=3403460 RepID=UPI003C7674BA